MENRPRLLATIELPDGRRYRTDIKQGLLVSFGAEFSLRTNHFDRRQIRIVVEHDRAGTNQTVGTVNIPLGQIISGEYDVDELKRQAPAITGTQFVASPDADDLDGDFSNLTPDDGAENQAKLRPHPASGKKRVQLSSVDTVIATSDNSGDGGDGPDPFLVVRQSGNEVIVSPTKHGAIASWTFARTFLFLDPQETLTIDLIDQDFGDNQTIGHWTMTGAQLLESDGQLATPRGTTLRMHFAEGHDDPE
jgi:hypothetical protein